MRHCTWKYSVAVLFVQLHRWGHFAPVAVMPYRPACRKPPNHPCAHTLFIRDMGKRNYIARPSPETGAWASADASNGHSMYRTWRPGRITAKSNRARTQRRMAPPGQFAQPNTSYAKGNKRKPFVPPPKTEQCGHMGGNAQEMIRFRVVGPPCQNVVQHILSQPPTKVRASAARARAKTNVHVDTQIRTNKQDPALCLEYVAVSN